MYPPQNQMPAFATNGPDGNPVNTAATPLQQPVATPIVAPTPAAQPALGSPGGNPNFQELRQFPSIGNQGQSWTPPTMPNHQPQTGNYYQLPQGTQGQMPQQQQFPSVGQFQMPTQFQQRQPVMQQPMQGQGVPGYPMQNPSIANWNS